MSNLIHLRVGNQIKLLKYNKKITETDFNFLIKSLFNLKGNLHGFFDKNGIFN